MQLSHLALTVPDVDRAADFYEDVVGLTRQEHFADGVVRLGWGRGFHALELRPGPLGLDHFGFEVRGARDLEALAAPAGGETDSPPGDHPAVHALRDPDGNRVELHARVDRSGERAADTCRRPIRIQHLTLGTPDVEAMVSFYEETLGMRVSDRMGDVFTWLRSDRDHHSLAVVKSDQPGLDHYSYDLADWDDVKHWCDELSKRQVPLLWGPGRHGPGNNIFLMFADSSGVRVELSAEMERYWDDRALYEPRQWEQVPETVNLWGPQAEWRKKSLFQRGSDEQVD